MIALGKHGSNKIPAMREEIKGNRKEDKKVNELFRHQSHVLPLKYPEVDFRILCSTNVYSCLGAAEHQTGK